MNAFKHVPSCVTLLLGLFAIASVGCAVANRRVELPSADQFEREQLRIFSDIHLPRNHRLLDELTARRRDIADKLLLPMSDEPINVYLFEDEKRFFRYLKQNHPLFPVRRAFFVKNDTDLKVFAHWGQQVGEDLRHEVTHGYLHAVVPNIPLWLDEGLAEYFELPRGTNGVHHQHIFFLTENAKRNKWQPSLERLEDHADDAELSQADYAESWLWVHFLLESKPKYRTLIQDQLARYRMTGNAEHLSQYLDALTESANTEVIDHLAALGEEIQDQQIPADE